MKRILLYLTLSVILPVVSMAQQPTAQPSNLHFTNVTPYNFILSFDPSVADGFLILKGTSEIIDVPVNGVTYEKGQGLTSCKVLSVSAGSSFNVREVWENTQYFFKIFAYNGTGSGISYLQTNPLTDSVITFTADDAGYYQTIDSTLPTFVDDVHNLINQHTANTYSPGYINYMIQNIYERDTIGGQAVVNCEYSGETTVYTPPFSFNAQVYNREHVLCKSWMRTAAVFPAGDLINYTEGSDYFNLLLSKAAPNNKRSNNPLGIVATQTYTYGLCKFGGDNTGNNVFEPRADRKGDAARAMMYEMICYNGLQGSWALDSLLLQGPQQDQNTLKLWNQQDPPDKFERTKNAYINSIQNNRNPFIDHPQWAMCIDFDNLSSATSCFPNAVNEQVSDNAAIHLFPNPAASAVNLVIETLDFNKAEITVLDIYGRRVLQGTIQNTNTSLDISQLETGNYFVRLLLNGQTAVKKLVVSR